MESGEETRVVCIRGCDNAVLQQNQTVLIQISNSLHILVPQYREAQPRCCHAEATPDTEAIEIRDQMLHTPFNVREADLRCAGVGETYVITLVVSIEDPRAVLASLTAARVNAFEYLMRHGQAVHRRIQCISRSDVSGWLNAGTAEGRLRLRLQNLPSNAASAAQHQTLQLPGRASSSL